MPHKDPAKYKEYQHDYHQKPEVKKKSTLSTVSYYKTPRGKMTRRKHLDKRDYGLSPGARAEMLLAQGNKCKSCGRPDPGISHGWELDHIRGTKIIRGILCHGCNQRAGSGYDAAEDLYQARKVVEYLETFYGGNISEG